MVSERCLSRNETPDEKNIWQGLYLCRLPASGFGEFSEDAADRGVNFAKLRKRSESESEGKKSNKEKRCVPKY